MALITVRQLDNSIIQSLTNKSPAVPFQFKRGTTPLVGIQFGDENGNAVALSAGAVVTLGVKPVNPNNTASGPATPAFDGPYTMSGSTSAGPDSSDIYWVPLNFATNAALNALLGYNPPSDNDDIASVTLFAEVAWLLNGGTFCDKSITFSIVVNHDLDTTVEANGAAGSPGSPSSLYVNNWPTVTALAGGGGADLDAVVTQGVLGVGTAVLLVLTGGHGASIWQLQARTDATAGGLQRPLDYSAATNPVVWTQVI